MPLGQARRMVVTRAELLAQGLSQSAITDRCRRGMYTRLLPGTYCSGPPTGWDRCRAIVAWQPLAVLSHRTAAWLRDMQPEPEVFEATVPPGSYRKTPHWLRLYRRELPAGSVDESREVPMASAALTLFDCVSVLPREAADRLVDKHLGRTVSPPEIVELCRSGKHGTVAMRRQLREAALHAASEPERLFARAMRRRGLPMLANHPVGPFVCDLVHEETRTVVEIDGREFHSQPEVFRQDRRRQNWLVLSHRLVLRYAAADVFRELEGCADEVAAVIRQRRRGLRAWRAQALSVQG
ncbi:DUF559 domain-containing protein [Nocardia sp. NPDC050712]|uniref:DUF559 domain-containing protein n=1 Tax=Nocardia sp. NPDC050712 TaxID=3155518 RepID=UPI0033FC2CC9